MASFIDHQLKAWQITAPLALSITMHFQIKPVMYALFCNLIGHVKILPHGTKIEYAFHQTLFPRAIKGLGTRLDFGIPYKICGGHLPC